MHPNLLVGAFTLLAAMQFAGATLLVKRSVQEIDSVTGALVAIGVSLAVFAVPAPFLISWEDWGSPAVWVFAAIGLLRPAFSTMLAFEGNRVLGPTVAVTVESISPLFAVTGGVLLLSETLTLGAALGALGVVAGVMVLTYQGGGRREWPLWALVLPLGAALIRSSAHVGAKWGLNILPNVLLSGLVAYAVSFVIAFGMAMWRGEAGKVRVSRRAWRWLLPTGLLNAGAIFSLNMGLMLGEVGLVSPLAATVPVFTLLGSWWFYGRASFTGRTVVGVLLVVPSVVLVTLSH